MYEAAKAVQNGREISERIYVGGVAAAVESASGKIYVGVCVDTSCTLGICAERNAIFNMITNGEQDIKRVLAIMPDGKTGAPCGACREFMTQMMPGRYHNIEIMLDYENERIVTLGGTYTRVVDMTKKIVCVKNVNSYKWAEPISQFLPISALYRSFRHVNKTCLKQADFTGFFLPDVLQNRMVLIFFTNEIFERTCDIIRLNR